MLIALLGTARIMIEKLRKIYVKIIHNNRFFCNNWYRAKKYHRVYEGSLIDMNVFEKGNVSYLYFGTSR